MTSDDPRCAPLDTRVVQMPWREAPQKTAGPKGEEVTRRQREMQEGKLADLYSSSNMTRRVQWARQVARILRKSKHIERKRKKERSRGRPKHRWKDSITI